MSEHPVYRYPRRCDWEWEERAALYKLRLHPLIASIMAHEDLVLTKPPPSAKPHGPYERSRARRRPWTASAA